MHKILPRKVLKLSEFDKKVLHVYASKSMETGNTESEATCKLNDVSLKTVGIKA